MPNNTDIEIRSEEVQEILTMIPSWMIRRGNILVLGLILLLLFISWFVRYPDIISAEAVVTTDIPPEKIYSKSTGKLEYLLIDDATTIDANTPIAIIENTANFKDVFYLKSIIDTITISRKNFNFPIDSLPILFLGPIETDYALFENAYLQYQLNQKLQPYSSESTANRIALVELKTRLNSLKSQKDLNSVELELKKRDLERQKLLYEKGVISAQEYENNQRIFLQAKSANKSLDISISQLKESISNGKKNIKGTQINKTKDDLRLLKGVIQSFNQLKRAVKDWEFQYVLKSSIVGKLSYLGYWHKNQIIHNGDLVFTVIPNNTTNFIAKVKAPTRNSGKIKQGQIVQIKLDNYPEYEFGMLLGKISKISLIPDEKGYYLIDVALPSSLLTTYNKKLIFKQEMSGRAEIITEDLRLIERFFYQLKSTLKKR